MSDRYLQYPAGTLSVTEIIKEAGLIYESDPWYMGRGQAVHAATEYHDRGTLDESTVAEEIRGYLEAWKKYRADTGYTPRLIEQELYHPVYKYCGRIDREGRDIKSGSFVKWHLLQGAAYNELEVENGISVAKREWQTVYLQGDGTYTVRNYGTIELFQAKKDFLTLLAAIRIKEKYA